MATLAHPTTGTNDAVTMVSSVTDRVHVLVPVQPPPDQPVKAEPVAGVAVRTTLVVALKSAAQVAPQLMSVVAAGVDVDVTVPVPVPARTMVRVFVGSEKVAVTVLAVATACSTSALIEGARVMILNADSGKLEERKVKTGLANWEFTEIVEGLAEGKWVLLDFGSVIVHIFYHETREFYGLERLWGEAKRI